MIAGFITASGVLIAASQLGAILGIKLQGQTLPELAASLWQVIGAMNPVTLALGLGATGFLVWVRRGMKSALRRMGVPPRLADLLTKAGPVPAVVVTTALTWGLGLQVAVLGEVPQSLPPFDLALWKSLALPALMISVVGFVESVSVAQTPAARKRQQIAPDQELIGLGAANLLAAFSGGFPVTGSFARSVANADAGAETPAAGAWQLRGWP